MGLSWSFTEHSGHAIWHAFSDWPYSFLASLAGGQ
jgi:hypothetical protein